MSLRKLAQKLLLFGVFLGPSSNIFATTPLKMSGPINVEPGELAAISISGIKGLNDPKITCIPENSSWKAMQELNGDPVLLLFTKKSGLYTFIVAGNKDNLTYFATFQVQVGKSPVPGPQPPDPSVSGKYTKQLTSVYLVSPNNTSLSKLISVYQAMASNSGSVVNYKQMNDALATATKSAIGDLDLRGLRDAVALILQSDLANRNSQTYDPAATKAIFEELAKSLTPLLEGK
jgi:hypothetical protein